MNTSSSHISFELDNDMSELDRLGTYLETFLATLGLTKRCIFQIRFSVDELFTNVVSYAFKDGRRHRIKFDLTYSQGILEVRMEDDGIPFDPTKVKPPDIDKPLLEREEGGLGIHTCRHFLTELSYKRIGEKNVLTMKKKLTLKANGSC